MAKKAGRVCAVALWFELHMGTHETKWYYTAPEIESRSKKERITTSPLRSSFCSKSCWEQAVFPLRDPVNLKAGDEVDVDIELKGHFTMSKFEPLSKRGEDRKSLLSVPKEFLTTMNDTKLMESYDKIACGLKSRGKLRILDATRCGGLISLFAMKYAKKGDIQTTFLIPSELSASPDGVENLLNFVEGVCKNNGIDMDNISFVGEAALEDNEEDDKYDYAIGDPVSMEHGGTDASAVARMARLIKCGLAKAVLPSSLSIRCRFVNSEKLLRASKLVSDSNVHDLKISEVVNRYSIERMRKNYLGDVCRKVVSRNP